MEAGFTHAIAHILKVEGGFVDHSMDSGGPTKYGISESLIRSLLDHPENHIFLGNINDLRKSFIEQSDMDILAEWIVVFLSRDRASKIYYHYFWQPNNYDKIEHYLIAAKIMDMSVNLGAPKANHMLQTILNDVFNYQLKLDGIVGEKTLAAINKANPDKFMKYLKRYQKQYYIDIVNSDDSQNVFLKGWLARASWPVTGDEVEIFQKHIERE